jgi:hypothetical protein
VLVARLAVERRYLSKGRRLGREVVLMLRVNVLGLGIGFPLYVT